MKKISLPLTVLALVSSVSPLSINAQTVLINDNFESYTVPNVPTNPGDGNANNWVFAATTNATTALGSSPNGSGDNEQILRLQKTNDSTAARATRLFDSQNSGTLQFDLKFRIHDFTGSATNIQIGDLTASGGVTAAPINLFFNTTGDVRVYSGDGAPGGGSNHYTSNPQGSALVVDNWYQLSIVANLDTQTFGVTINNLDNPLQTGSLSNLYFATNTNVFDGFRVNSNSGSSNNAINWSLDDVYFSIIPEPGTAALLLFGSFGCALLRRSRRG